METEKEDRFEFWKLDTATCKKIRTAEDARYIEDSLNWENKTKKFVIDILGNPDTLIILNKKSQALVYYYDTPCYNGIMDTLDNCWVDIIIVSNKVKFVGIGCK
jgi:hypothetical protein